MHDYSVHLLDARGRTLTTDLMPFADRNAAILFARKIQSDHAIVEVWRENTLVIRLFRDPPPIAGHGIDPPALALAAFSRADALGDDKPSRAASMQPAALAISAGATKEPIIVPAKVQSPFATSNVNDSWGPFRQTGFAPWKRPGVKLG